MSTLILENSHASARSVGWIISKRQDLAWFIGSALAGYLSLAILSAAPHNYGFMLSVFWWSLINNPHIFGTASRTYFDADERKRLSYLLWMIVPLSLIPVLIIGAGFAEPMFVFALAWGNWHVAKQHFGIMMLYKRKHAERSDVNFDKRFLLISQTLPFILFIAWYLKFDVALLFNLALTAQVIMCAAYLYRQIVKYRSGQQMNWPKLMLVALVIPLHWLAFIVASTDRTNGIFIFTIATNIGHALQYHRLTWFHNHNRYAGKPGVSGVLGRSVVYYYAAGFGLYLVFVAIAQLLPSGGMELILMGPTFTHYLLDTKIWRVRNDPELAKALRLT